MQWLLAFTDFAVPRKHLQYYASHPKRAVLLQALASGGILQAWPCAILYTYGFFCCQQNHRYMTGLRRRSAACVWQSSLCVACGLCHQACRLSAQQQAHAFSVRALLGVLLLCVGGTGSIEGQGRVRLQCRAWWTQSAVCGVLCRPSRGVMYCPACVLCQGCAILTIFPTCGHIPRTA